MYGAEMNRGLKTIAAFGVSALSTVMALGSAAVITYVVPTATYECHRGVCLADGTVFEGTLVAFSMVNGSLAVAALIVGIVLSMNWDT